MRKLVAATALLICLGAASASSAGAAKAPPEFYGVIPAHNVSDQEFNRMGQGRVGSVRVNLLWSHVQPINNPAYFDWSQYDQIVGDAAERNIRVFFTIYSSPQWVAPVANHPPGGQYLDEYEAFVRAAVQRYGPNGDFWTLNPLVPKLPIKDWQLWNEFNSPSFWLPKPKPKQFRPLLQATHRAVKGVDPNGRIVLGGLFRKPNVKNGVTAKKYLIGLYKLKQRRYFDAVAIHPYALTPAIALDAIADMREIMRAFKDKRKPIYVTEVGWATQGQRTPLTVTRGKQAKYLRQTYNLAAANRKKMKIAGVFWYSLKDVPGAIWFNNTGLFTEGGAAKPSWNAFVRLTGGTP